MLISILFAAALASASEPRVFAALAAAQPQLRRCHTDAVDENATGMLILTWQVTAAGAFRDVVVYRDLLPVPAISLCVVKVIESLQVAPAADATTVTETLYFPQAETRLQGGLRRADIQRSVNKAAPLIKRCYASALSMGRPVSGRVRFTWKIGADGTATEVVVVNDTLGLPAATACMKTALSELTYPRPLGGGFVTVDYPFVFDSCRPNDDGCEREAQAPVERERLSERTEANTSSGGCTPWPIGPAPAPATTPTSPAPTRRAPPPPKQIQSPMAW